MSKLKSVRVLKNMKQNDMALKLGITPQYLCRIENGKVDTKISVLVKASKILDVPLQELID